MSVTHDGTAAFKVVNRIELAMRAGSLAAFLMGAVKPRLQRSSAELFDTQGAALGGWAPLKELTVKIRESQGFGGREPINVRTGRLKSYVLENTGRIQQDVGTALIWPGRLPEQGGELFYRFHLAQKGNPAKRVPARPVVALQFDDMVHINLALGRFLDLAVQS